MPTFVRTNTFNDSLFSKFSNVVLNPITRKPTYLSKFLTRNIRIYIHLFQNLLGSFLGSFLGSVCITTL